MYVCTYLMSVNVDGTSTISAPPKSGVLRKVVMLGMIWVLSCFWSVFLEGEVGFDIAQGALSSIEYISIYIVLAYVDTSSSLSA